MSRFAMIYLHRKFRKYGNFIIKWRYFYFKNDYFPPVYYALQI